MGADLSCKEEYLIEGISANFNILDANIFR